MQEWEATRRHHEKTPKLSTKENRAVTLSEKSVILRATAEEGELLFSWLSCLVWIYNVHCFVVASSGSSCCYGVFLLQIRLRILQWRTARIWGNISLVVVSKETNPKTNPKNNLKMSGEFRNIVLGNLRKERWKHGELSICTISDPTCWGILRLLARVWQVLLIGRCFL